MNLPPLGGRSLLRELYYQVIKSTNPFPGVEHVCIRQRALCALDSS